MVDNLTSLLSFFEFKRVYNVLNSFKQKRGYKIHDIFPYLNLGGCQSKNFDAQIADTTISMIQYILLTLTKRFDDYETRGEIFRSTGEEMPEQRLHLRLWKLLIVIMKIIIETLYMIVEDIDASITRLIN